MKIIDKVNEIIEGWSNVIGGNDIVKLIATYRLKICMTANNGEPCKKMSKMHVCMACGCPLKAKTASMSSKCKKGYWLPVNINHLSDADIDNYTREVSNT